MKPNHANIPLVMQRAKELHEKFASIRTDEAIAQGRYFDRQARPFRTINVNRIMSTGNGKSVSLRLDVVKMKRNPLFSCRKGNPIKPGIDNRLIPSPFVPSPYPCAVLTETKSIGQGVPRLLSKGKNYNTDPKTRTRKSSEFQSFRALVLELARVCRLKDGNDKLADNFVALASSYKTWQSLSKQERVSITRSAIMRVTLFQRSEARKAGWIEKEIPQKAQERIAMIEEREKMRLDWLQGKCPLPVVNNGKARDSAVKIIGTVKPSSKKSNARRKANRKAAIKRASQK